VDSPVDNLHKLFTRWSKEEGIEILALPAAGSDRQYYRLTGQTKVAIGVYGPDRNENSAFLGFTRHFRDFGLPVPEIYSVDEEHGCYLMSDLGDVSLLQHLESRRIAGRPDESSIRLYRMAIAELPRFQIEAGSGINYNLCYPVRDFDARSMRWDLNYYKYYFLRMHRIPFNEFALENDFDRLVLYLLKAGNDAFMYRDFQARNIMVQEDTLGFIDYQGGRRGPLQYDLASLLFQVKAELPYDFREEMLHWYLECLSVYRKVDVAQFTRYYYGFVLLRLLQVLGAYGFRGYYERRAHFLQSIPYAIENVQWWLKTISIEPQLPELMKTLHAVSELNIPRQQAAADKHLHISVNSFSYKNGPPPDYSGNGGGFVFDCRALPNPGRYEHFKSFSGRDPLVIHFLEREQQVNNFLHNVFKIIDQSILEYQKRSFTNLHVSFGCTGGQHRSVYCAERLAHYLEEKYLAVVSLNHAEQGKSWR